MVKPRASQSRNRRGTFKLHLHLKSKEHHVVQNSPPNRHLTCYLLPSRVTRAWSSVLQQKSCQGSAKDWAEENPVSKMCLATRSCVRKYRIPRLATLSFSFSTTSGATFVVRLVKAPASNFPMLKARATELTLDQS